MNHFIVVYLQLQEPFITTSLIHPLPLLPFSHIPTKPLCSNRNLNLNTSLDVDDDLLDDLSRRMEIDETYIPLISPHLIPIPNPSIHTLVNAHLKGIPSL